MKEKIDRLIKNIEKQVPRSIEAKRFKEGYLRALHDVLLVIEE